MVNGNKNCIWKGNLSSHVTGSFMGTQLYEVSYPYTGCIIHGAFLSLDEAPQSRHHHQSLHINDVTHSVVSRTAMKIFSSLCFLFQICTNWTNGKH